jgi:hypothetical protein
MTEMDLLKLVAALMMVLAAMGGLALLIKQSGLAGAFPKTPPKKRLKVLESLNIDGRRRAILLACDDNAHLIILNGNTETVIKTDLPVPSAEDTSFDAADDDKNAPF